MSYSQREARDLIFIGRFPLDIPPACNAQVLSPHQAGFFLRRVRGVAPAMADAARKSCGWPGHFTHYERLSRHRGIICAVLLVVTAAKRPAATQPP